MKSIKIQRDAPNPDTPHQQDLHLHIPLEILEIPDLTLTERAALAQIDENAFITNGELGRLLCLSKTGVEALIRRLKRRGFIEQFRKGRARELTFDMFHREPLS